MKLVIVKLFLRPNVPLNRTLHLCPRFKAKVLSKAMPDFKAKLKAKIKGIACNMAHRVDLLKVRDNKVAKIIININKKS